MSEPTVSVLLHNEEYLPTISAQGVADVELITWGDTDWHDKATTAAEEHGSSHKRMRSATEALEAADGEFLIEWNVYRADEPRLRASSEQLPVSRAREARWPPTSIQRSSGGETSSFVRPAELV